MRKRGLLLCLIISFLVLNLSLGWAAWRLRSKPKDELYEKIELFTDAITTIQSEYVEEVNPKDLIYGALKGMLASLDPYSQFLDPDTYNEMKVDTEGKFGGLGIEITIKDGLLTIVTPLDDTPAHRAGLKAGDRIVKIDGELTKDITLLEAVKKLRGQPGTKVSLTVWRNGEEKLLDFTITRDIIKIESVKGSKLIQDKIGYIRVVEFRENTPADLEKALVSLEKEGMDSLILDLRNNPGGLLDVAVTVAEKFIEKGKVIVSTKGRIKSQNLEYKSKGKNTHLKFPLVLLINEGSASGSEIVAGAIQDHKRGIILGTKTFGKASVQTIVPLKDGSALRLTTSKYFTPSGRSIHGEGISPDLEVELTKAQPTEEPKGPEDIFERIEDEGLKLKQEQKEPKEETFPAYDSQVMRAIELLKGIRVYRNLGG